MSGTTDLVRAVFPAVFPAGFADRVVRR